MSLDKGIKHGKEKRRKHRGTKAVDHTCRNNESCERCKSNRLYRHKKREATAEDSLDEI